MVVVAEHRTMPRTHSVVVVVVGSAVHHIVVVVVLLPLVDRVSEPLQKMMVVHRACCYRSRWI